MKVSLMIEATAEAAEKLNIVYQISDFLYGEMVHKEYGNVVKEIVCIFNCYNPDFGALIKTWETGTVINKKYIKRNNYLEFSVKINYADLIQAPLPSVPNIVKEAVLKTYSAVRDLNIKDFKIDEFYSDLERLLMSSKWQTASQVYVNEGFDLRKTKPLGSKTLFKALKERDFWDIIKYSIEMSGGRAETQIDKLENILITSSEEDIIGFEITLRSLLKKAYHTNVLALNKVAEGFVTDDSFLYFRANLTLYGEKNFYQAIADPNKLSIVIGSNYGEEVLNIANKAFKSKKGENYYGELPRDVGADQLNYDDLSQNLDGAMWKTEMEFNNKYSSVVNLYKNEKK